MLEAVTGIDARILIWIHQNLHLDFLDGLMVLLRNKWTWLPLYVFLIAFVALNFGKRGWLWMLFFIFVVALSDTVSTKVIKYQVKRLRPCHTEMVVDKLELLIPCGGQYGFVSSHATNHFAMAAFFFFTLGQILRRWRWPALIWAASVGFAQVYVGVHYPLDIVAGAILGILIGWGIAWYYNMRLKNLGMGHGGHRA